MDLKISRTIFIEIFWKSILILILCENIYNHGKSTGTYNKEILFILIIVGFLISLKKVSNKVYFNKPSFVQVFVIIYIALWSVSNESIRYALTFMVFLLWCKIYPKSLKKFYYIIIILGSIFSILQRHNGIERVSGFFATSPTLFSFIILIAIVYLLFAPNFRKLDFAFVIIGIILIVLSQSRSTLGVALFFSFYQGLNLAIMNWNLKVSLKKKIFTMVFIVGIALVISNKDVVLLILSRENGNSSNLTRIELISYFYNMLISSPIMIVFGAGGGFALKTIRSTILGSSSIVHLPLHQDILMLICEYGIFGIFLIYFVFLKEVHWKWFVWTLWVLGSFHNIIISPICVVLLVITGNSLSTNKYFHQDHVKVAAKPKCRLAPMRAPHSN